MFPAAHPFSVNEAESTFRDFKRYAVQRGSESGVRALLTHYGLDALNAMEMRSPSPSNFSTRCSSHDGKISNFPVAGVMGIPMPEPSQGSSMPGVSYMATAGPRGSRK